VVTFDAESSRTALEPLVTDGLLTTDQVDAVIATLSAAAPTTPTPSDAPDTSAAQGGDATQVAAPTGSGVFPAPAGVRAGWLAEVAGYLGGGLMLGAIVLVLGTSWAQLTRAGRVGILFGISAVLVAAAVVIADGKLAALGASAGSAKRRVVGALLGVAVVPIMPAVGQMLSGLTERWSAGAVVALFAAVVAQVLVPNAFGVVVMAVATFTVALTVGSDLRDESQASDYAFTFISAGIVWAAASVSRRIRPRGLGLGFAATFALIGAQTMLSAATDQTWPGYTLTAVVAAACLALYPRVPEPILVIAAVVGVTLAVTQALYDWSGGELQAAYIVLIGGAVLVAASVAALRYQRAARPDA
jgi:hypothetical protein